MRLKRAPVTSSDRCENCTYFYQHYTRIKSAPGDYVKCFCGHCIVGKIPRNAKPNQICDYFQEKHPVSAK